MLYLTTESFRDYNVSGVYGTAKPLLIKLVKSVEPGSGCKFLEIHLFYTTSSTRKVILILKKGGHLDIKNGKTCFFNLKFLEFPEYVFIYPD